MRRTAEVRVDGHKWFVGRTQVGWEEEDSINFHLEDVKLVNVWGKELNDVRLNHEDGKIIGDE